MVDRESLGSVLGQRGYIRGPFGSALRRPELLDEGVAVYEQQHAISGSRKFRFFVSEEKFEELSRFQVRPNDLIISCSGTVGKISIIRPEDPRGIISQALLILRPRTDKILPEFLYYFFMTEQGQNALTQASHGSVQVNIAPRAVVEQIELPVPTLPEQGAVVRILGALDDKIELNRRMNRTLEEMARGVFRSWFVDFDPVRAKGAGRAPEGMDAETAALFPSEMMSSEVGKVPEGWKVSRFADTVSIIGGGTPSTSDERFWGGQIPWFSVVDAPSVGDVFVIDTEKRITDEGLRESSARLLKPGTTILSARGTVGRVALTAVEMAMNQSCYGVRGRSNGVDAFTYFTTLNLVSTLRQHSHGSVFDTITRATLASVSIVEPSVLLAQEFDRRVAPLLGMILSHLREAEQLSAIRDALLPRLLSGKFSLIGEV